MISALTHDPAFGLKLNIRAFALRGFASQVEVEFQGFADPSWPLEFILSGWIVY